MLFFENISLAVSGLLANKMRAMLTMLGIIIGIGSVIAIMTVGDSMTNSITESMQSMGVNNITISLTQKTSGSTNDEQSTMRMFMRSNYAAEDLMTDEMLAEFRTAFGDDVFAVETTESVGSATAANGTSEATVNITGLNEEGQTVENVEIINGRFITDADGEALRTTAVVSDVLCEALFPGQDPIGQSFTVPYNGKIITFYVVGVYEYTTSTTMQSSDTPTTSMYIPLKVAKQITGENAGYSSFTVVSSTTAADDFMTQAGNFFASYYTHNDSYTAEATSLGTMVETMTSMMNTIKLAISVIAGISLLVGGIGVMNIMLVSITERTREIGTRKALGATNGSIRLQFIVESVIICLIGGIMGILLGLALGAGGAKLLGYAATPSVTVIIIAVAFSMSIGVFFGYYPANKAAKMDPVEALRYE